MQIQFTLLPMFLRAFSYIHIYHGLHTYVWMYVYFILFHSSVNQYIMTEVLFILVAGAFKYFHIQFNLHSWYWKNIFHITSFQYFNSQNWNFSSFSSFLTKHYNNTINFFHLNFFNSFIPLNIKYNTTNFESILKFLLWQKASIINVFLSLPFSSQSSMNKMSWISCDKFLIQYLLKFFMQCRFYEGKYILLKDFWNCL